MSVRRITGRWTRGTIVECTLISAGLCMSNFKVETLLLSKVVPHSRAVYNVLWLGGVLSQTNIPWHLCFAFSFYFLYAMYEENLHLSMRTRLPHKRFTSPFDVSLYATFEEHWWRSSVDVCTIAHENVQSKNLDSWQNTCDALQSTRIFSSSCNLLELYNIATVEAESTKRLPCLGVGTSKGDHKSRAFCLFFFLLHAFSLTRCRLAAILGVSILRRNSLLIQ